MKTKAFRKFFGTFAVLAFALGAGIALRSVSAGTETGSGWLWGGGVTTNPVGYGGIGWISANDINPGSGGGTYGMDIPSTDGAVSGYAWWGHGQPGGNGDWLDFQPAGPYPGVPNSGVERQGDTLVGWARFVGIRNALSSGNAGGFDGWVKMSGVAADGSPYGVSVIGGGTALSGYAWSSDFGWINFGAEGTSPGVSIGAIVATDTLEICIDDGSGTLVLLASGNGSTFILQQMEIGDGKTLKAFYDNDGIVCGPIGSDITSTATWNAALNNPDDAVNVVSGVVQAIANGTESFTVSSNGQTITGTVTVAPLVPPCSSCTDEQAQHCKSDNWTSGCSETCGPGNPVLGTRYCDMNWKEVAPGQ